MIVPLGMAECNSLRTIAPDLALLHNYESNAVVLGADFGKPMWAMFDQDMAASEHITLERWL